MLQVLETDDGKGMSLLRLQSKEQRYVRASCLATVGEVRLIFHTIILSL
jgi:ribosomal protein L2